MGIFSRPGRKASKPNTNESSSSLTSNNSSMRSPALLNMPNGSSTSTNLGPFSPISAPPPHIPKIAMPKAPDPKLDPAAYLKSIGSVRQRCHLVLGKAKKNQLNHFTVDMSKFEDTTKFVVSIIKRDFAPDYSSIPPHGRWQHFNVGGRDRISALLASFPSSVDTAEKTRRLIDLFLVSVLLDAGAGTSWSYKSIESGRTYKRSEGLAVASLEMFKAGLFSSNSSQPCQVDGEALKMLTVDIVGKALQVSEQNPITGLEGRTNLLIRLSSALNNTDLFGADARPGNMLDFLLAHPTTQATSVPIIPLPTLWSVIIDGLAPDLATFPDTD